MLIDEFSESNQLMNSIERNEKNTFPGTPYLIPAPKGLRGGALEIYMKEFNARGLTEQQKSALIGTLLGDATLQYNEGTIPWYKFDQKAANKEYVEALYFLFADVVGTPPINPRIKNGIAHSYWFRTYRWMVLDFYAKQFYKIDSLGNRKKIVPPLIHRWLSPQALAFWFMDDGSKKNSTYLLHTQGFTRPEIIRLQQALGKNFNIESKIHKDKRPSGPLYYLYISTDSGKKFQEIIEPYVLPCMRYKL
jgi:hypothetical protein